MARTWIAAGAPSIVPSQTGCPGRQSDATLTGGPSLKRTTASPRFALHHEAEIRSPDRRHAVDGEDVGPGDRNLSGNGALAGVVEVVDHPAHRRHLARGFAGGGGIVETVGELLGQGSRSRAALRANVDEPSARPKRNVVADAGDGEGIERRRLGLHGRRPRRTVRDELGDHRIVVDRDFAAFDDAGVHPHRHAPPPSPRAAAGR